MWYCTVCALVTFTLSILTTFSVVEAQPTGKVYRIGLLTEGTRMTALLEALRVLGYIDGHNLVLEQRHAERPEQLPAFAAELVTRQVDLIVTVGTPATRAAKQATTTVPIVFTLSADPVQSELVASLARPGVNLTGYTSGVQTDKMLEILKEAVPGIVRVACPRRSDPTDPFWVQAVDAARVLGLELQAIDVQGPDDFERFFAAAPSVGADAILVHDEARFSPHLARLGQLAAQSRLPAIGFRRQFAEGGGLLAYSRKQGENISRMAAQVDKILKGAQPADIPVERPIRFELVINLKTAQTLGLTIPPVLLFQADEVLK